MNLSKMSNPKLESLLANIRAELKRRKEIEKNRVKALKELKALAEKYEMSVSELTGVKKGRGAGKRGKVPPKYRNPTDPSQTWSGRGRTPKWVLKAERKPGGRKKLEI